jgi:chromosome segregation ATPase
MEDLKQDQIMLKTDIAQHSSENSESPEKSVTKSVGSKNEYRSNPEYSETAQSEYAPTLDKMKTRLRLDGNASYDSMLDTLKVELDDRNKQLKSIKKEINLLSREHTKLQSELKTKNETINSLINQNFNELNTLKSKHQDTIANITTSYDTNLKMVETRYKTFRGSFDRKLKDTIDTHYKFSNEKGTLLSDQNKNLISQIAQLQTELSLREKELRELRVTVESVNATKESLETRDQELSRRKEILESQVREIKGLYENSTDVVVQNDKIIRELTDTKEDLLNQMESQKNIAKKCIDKASQLEKDMELVKATYGDIHNKYTLVLNDNVNKQNSLDEKTLEILAVHSKANEQERKIISLESNRKELNVRITEMINEIDLIKMDLLEKQKLIQQLKSEKEILLDEKAYFIAECESLKTRLKESESMLMEKLRVLQEQFSKEKERINKEADAKVMDQKDRFEKQLQTIKLESNTIISDREKQMESLSAYVKSFTESQYVTINEIEKLKILNEKLRSEQATVDKRIGETHAQYKKEIDELQSTHTKEKDSLMETYNDAIKKSQEMNDTIQTRLNQTVEALSLTKITISNLKDANINLEKQMQGRDDEQINIYEKYNELKAENKDLKDKLDRSIELSTTLSSREKQYEMQIRQMQAKYNQVMSAVKNGGGQ